MPEAVDYLVCVTARDAIRRRASIELPIAAYERGDLAIDEDDSVGEEGS